MGQLNYGGDQPIGFHGQIASHRLKDVVSKNIEEDMTPGVVVSQGTGVNGVILGAGVIQGITVRKLDTIANASGNIEYISPRSVGVIKKGEIYILLTTSCTVNDLVKFDDATGAILVGAVAADQTNLAGARCLSTNSAAGIAKIELDLQIP